LLHERAINAGQLWAQDVHAALRDQGRALDGGWPGTVSEARSKIIRELDRELGMDQVLAISHEELEVAVRTTFARARQGWLERGRQAGRRAESRDVSDLE
jgi:hypothetical protein